MPHTPHHLVHQRSESSFLLVRPVSPSVQDPLPTWPTSPWHYVVPALALIDLFTTIVLGGLVVRTEERVLLGWGLVRAGIVGQVGWTRSRSSVRGGAGWVAVTTMISFLLVFWRLNVLIQTRGPIRQLDSSSPVEAMLRLDSSRHPMQPHYLLLLTTSIFAFLDYSAVLSVDKFVPRAPDTPRLSPFAIRRPRQSPSPFRFATDVVPGITSPSVSPTVLAAGPSSTHPSYFLRNQRAPGMNRSSTGLTSAQIEAEYMDFEDEDSVDDELDDDEIVDIPPPGTAIVGEFGGIGAEDDSEDGLARSLSRSFSRRRIAQTEEPDEETRLEAGEGGIYGAVSP